MTASHFVTVTAANAMVPVVLIFWCVMAATAGIVTLATVSVEAAIAILVKVTVTALETSDVVVMVCINLIRSYSNKRYYLPIITRHVLNSCRTI